MKRAFVFPSILLILLFISASPLHAQQGGKITFGNLSVIPGITVNALYDDNIYLKNGKDYPGEPDKTAASKKVSDWITHIKPGLLLSYEMPERGYISLGYQGDFALYRDNTANNWQNNQGNFEVNYHAPGGLIVGINEAFARAEDPYGGPDQYQIGRITKRYTNDLKTKVGYTSTANFRSFLYFNNYKQKYDNSQFDFSQDYTDTEYGIGTELRFLPKTWAFLRYHYGTRAYNTAGPGQTDAFNSDSTWHRANAGLTWDPGAKLSGELNVGYQWRKNDHEFTDAARTARREDTNTWIAATSLSFAPAEGTLLVMNLTRSVRSTGSDTNEQFVDTGIGLNLQQKLLFKLSLRAGLSYSKNEYNIPAGNERTDNNYLANIGLDYNIRDWLTFGVGYNYNRKDSNVDTQEFTDNQYMAQVKIVY